jgi:hypothetical protein
MEISTDQLPWHPEDEEAWQKFLATQHGSRLIPKLLESAPELLDGEDVNKTLVRNGELRGWQAAVRTLITLSHAQPRLPDQTQNNYPAPEDDRQWADGEKITEQHKPTT